MTGCVVADHEENAVFTWWCEASQEAEWLMEWICILTNSSNLWQWIQRQIFYDGRMLLSIFSDVQIYPLVFCGCWHLCYYLMCIQHLTCVEESTSICVGSCTFAFTDGGSRSVDACWLEHGCWTVDAT